MVHQRNRVHKAVNFTVYYTYAAVKGIIQLTSLKIVPLLPFDLLSMVHVNHTCT